MPGRPVGTAAMTLSPFADDWPSRDDGPADVDAEVDRARRHEAEADIPARLAARPRDARGYPIPWVQYVAPDGTPDFRVIDDARRFRAWVEGRCGLCGRRIDGFAWMIGGPKMFANRLAVEAAMHEECARYAVRTCPFLVHPTARYAKPERVAARHEGEPGGLTTTGLRAHDIADGNRPEGAILLVRFRRYDVVRVGRDHAIRMIAPTVVESIPQ